ncbi:MAG: wax ester/triacylglycerol synthase family O-acyltransferase [Ilumatobacter sp.]
MQQLTGLDASWLYLETPTTPLHIGVINVFETPEGEFSPLRATRSQFASRVPLIEPLRRRLVEVPLGLSHPFWVIDADFDLDAHIHHHVAPAPDDDSVAQLIGAIMTPALDRSRPLWEAHVIEGLPGNKWAVLSKYHHATIDGGAGILLVHLLLDEDPEARSEAPGDLVPDAEPVPSDLALVTESAAATLRNPRELLGLQVKVARHLGERIKVDGIRGLVSSATTVMRSASGSSNPATQARSAPKTPWNRTIGKERTYAFRSLPIADVLALKTAVGSTLNDVVLAAAAGGLRRYLIAHDALPDRPLSALVPVSRRTGTEDKPWKNLISMIMSSLATEEADPHERFARTRQSMADAKGQLDFLPDDAIDGLADLMPASLASTAVQLSSRLRLTDRVGGPANLTISNVTGPRTPLFLHGARLTNLTPLSLLTDGIGLNITVLSCGQQFDFGLAGCAQALPDLAFLQECILDELYELYELHGVQPSEPRRRSAAPQALPPDLMESTSR